MNYKETLEQKLASVESMVEKVKKTQKDNCDLYALIYMRDWMKGIVDDLDKIIP